jgi:hypothetical protein
MNNKLETLSYNGTDVVAYIKDGQMYFKANEIAKMYGKEAREFFSLKKTIDYVRNYTNNVERGNPRSSEIMSGEIDVHANVERGNPRSSENYLYRTVKGRHAGTWIHRDMFILYAAWISPEFLMWSVDTLIRRREAEVRLEIKNTKALPKPLTEYDYSLALCRLLSYCRIPCFSEYEINSMDITAKTRRYDMVIDMYGTKYVIELKKDMITTDDVMSIFSRHYITGMEQIDSNAQLVIMSPNGIEDNALLLIDGLRDTTYQSLIDFSINCDSYLHRYYTNKLMIHNIHRELYILYGDKYVKEL